MLVKGGQGQSQGCKQPSMSEVFSTYIHINTSGLEPASHGSLPGSGAAPLHPLGPSWWRNLQEMRAKGPQVCLQEPPGASLCSRTSLDTALQTLQLCTDTSPAKKEQFLHHPMSLLHTSLHAALQPTGSEN